MAARADRLAVNMNVNVVPVDEGRLDQGRGFGIVGLEIGQGLVGEDHPPAEGVIRPVALVHDHAQRRIMQLQRYGEVKPARTGTHDGDAFDSATRRHALSLK